MEYIAHRRYKEVGVCGEQLNIPYGTRLETDGDFIKTKDGKCVCFTTSENAHIYFARNDDGKGLERGAITHAIAYGKRVPRRFSEEDIEILEKYWGKYLRQDADTILFNHDFFNADIEELGRMVDSLAKTKRCLKC
ncbi:hypothetical protein [Anaerolentibacter hominis]|uniref:hypothetical protein n=1 Tax=Anaerolentibacter hominis TaxID=3079009 RepID=UPI0031B84DF4